MLRIKQPVPLFPSSPGVLKKEERIPSFHPILFSTPMVKAILDGKKTVTRRIVKPQPDVKIHHTINMVTTLGKHPGDDFIPDGILYNGVEYTDNKYIKHPYGVTGDVLWVRETFREVMHDSVKGIFYQYKDLSTSTENIPATEIIPVSEWKPSIHMPKKACRIFLKITNWYYQPLLKINSADTTNEGFDSMRDMMHLWNEINPKHMWHTDPLVWVVEFERIEKPEGFA